MKPQYSQICGITRQELVDTFTPELIKTNPLSFNDTVEKMTILYNGYHFCEFAEGMLNPFRTQNGFDGYMFDNYWFRIGTPTFLVELLKIGL